jgi:hypothetical protein
MGTPSDYMATLVRGRYYALNTDSGEIKEFEAGRPLKVTAAEKAILDAHAVDSLGIEGTETHMQVPKFKFDPVAATKAEAEAEKPPVRARG